MLRSGARHPDAVESATPVASTSSTRVRSPEEQAHELYNRLNEYLLLEHKFQPRLCLPAESDNGEVTTGARDGAAHVLRCLKVWYDLPAEVLINAINLFDRFLTKMKVRPCHVPCITVSCMNIALEQYAADTNTKRSISVDELVSISQSACTAGDVCRMSRVIVDKLSLVAGCAVSALDWLRLLRAMLTLHAEQLCVDVPGLSTEQELVHLLEIVSCDATCVNARTSELALVLLYHKLEQQLSAWSASNGEESEHAYYLYDFARQLQMHCHMCDSSLASCRARVRHVVSRYERCEARRDQRQTLVWRLSERTLKVLRPTDRLTSMLPTIEEQHFQVDVTPTRNRSGSESSENEETSDWPRSPVLPVYCDN
ncbi:cyclin G [Anticarsia gemmatalis]|uniref:cyclin G n=1 Tax=Anticarsia gemmatalis TaxID=129554 RepID=UPI003F75EC50